MRQRVQGHGTRAFKDMERAAEQLYVGLSRARSLLMVVGDSGLLEEAGGRELKMALSKAQAGAGDPR